MADDLTEPTRTFKEMILYKIDRSAAIAGIVVMGLAALYIRSESSMQIAALCAGALATYIGNKAK